MRACHPVMLAVPTGSRAETLGPSRVTRTFSVDPGSWISMEVASLSNLPRVRLVSFPATPSQLR